MRSISLRMLFLVVALAALWTVVLVQPSLFWARLSLTLALVFVGWSIVLALAGRDASRRFGIAAAIFGGTYLGIVLHEPPQQFGGGRYKYGRMLITHPLLEKLAPLLGHNFPLTLQDFSLWDAQIYSTSTSVFVPPPGTPPGSMTFGGGGFGGGGGVGTGTVTVVPGASPHARYQQYLIGGHSMFAIVIGAFAGIVAARWIGKREGEATE